MDSTSAAYSISGNPTGTLDSGTAVPANANLLVFGGGTSDGGTANITGSPWQVIQRSGGSITEQTIVSGNNMLQRAPATLGASTGNWVMQMAIFRDASWTVAGGWSPARNTPIVYANQFPSIQAAINACNPSGAGCMVYVPPGTYTAPITSIPPNTEIDCIGPPMSGFIAGSFNAHSTATDQCIFNYSSTLTLSRLWNVRFRGITFNGQGDAISWILKESQFNIFDDCAVVNFGSSGIPAVQLSSQTTDYNTAHNLFRNFNIEVNSGAIAIQLLGSGTANAGPSVTDNKFYSLLCAANFLYCLDFELKSDTNYFYGVEANQCCGTPPTGSAFIAFNTIAPASDQDADDEYVQMIDTGSPAYAITAGQTYGDRVYMDWPGGCPTLHAIPGGTPAINLHSEGLFGTSTCDKIGGGTLTIGNAGSATHTILSGSATLTYGAIAANTCNQQDITVNGAVVGNTAWVSEGSALGNINLSWSAWIEFSNSVSVRLCIVSTTSITPNAVTWTAWVIQ